MRLASAPCRISRADDFAAHRCQPRAGDTEASASNVTEHTESDFL
jgi:hypothetical protein